MRLTSDQGPVEMSIISAVGSQTTMKTAVIRGLTAMEVALSEGSQWDLSKAWV